MKLNTKGQYAVIALVDMMRQMDVEKMEKPITLAEIAQRQNLSLVYLEQLFLQLKKAEIVTSVRGRKGGYSFALPLDKISIAMILVAVEEKVETLRCSDPLQRGCVPSQSYCQTHHLWASLEKHITAYFDTITLEDIRTNSFKDSSSPLSERKTVYLDYNATCPLKPTVKKAMGKALELVGNASSVHSYGRYVRSIIEQARKKVADYFHVLPSQVTFTSGATEANALALMSAVKGGGIEKLYISAIEHDSVRASAQKLAQELSLTLTMIPANEQGVITLETVKEILGDVQGKFLLCLMAANNETGVIQPLKAVAEYVHQRGGFLHCDAVQALGKMSLNFSDLEVDTISCSVHKIGGPMGVGVLIKKETFPLYSLWSGGGQERGYRSGTENVVSIIGFAEALISAKEEKREQWQKWQQELEEMLQKKVPNVKVFGQNSPRLTNTSCFTMPGVHQQQQVIAFDLAGYAVSAGAACSSGKVKPSHVLEAMGIATDEAQTALRLSWGWKTTWEDLQQFATTWYDIYQNQKKSKEV